MSRTFLLVSKIWKAWIRASERSQGRPRKINGCRWKRTPFITL